MLTPPYLPLGALLSRVGSSSGLRMIVAHGAGGYRVRAGVGSRASRDVRQMSKKGEVWKEYM
jgi:hypothetical protein